MYIALWIRKRRAVADYISFPDEERPRNGKRLKLFNPLHPYMKKYVENYEAVPMLEPIFINGQKVYELPELDEIRAYHTSQLKLFWPEYLRKLNPEIYRVNLSEKVWELKQKLIDSYMQPEVEEKE